MKKKILLTLLCIAAVAIAAFVGAKDSKSYISESMLYENIEAMSQTESGGISLEFCAESHSNSIWATGSNYKCASGTYTSLPVSQTPIGTIYSCSGPKDKSLVSAKMGYCYTKK